MVRDVIAVLNAGDLSQRLPHVYFTVPRAWNLPLPLDEGPPAITASMVVPVSEREYQYWREHGMVAFERAIDDAQIDVSDLKRTATL